MEAIYSLLIKHRADVNPNIDPMISDKMNRYQRYFHDPKICSRTAIRYYLYLFFTSCFISCITFWIILFTSNNGKMTIPLPKISKKETLSIYDRNIKYNDFNYLNNETLTYEKRTYSQNVQVLYRLPKKTSISALLLIFHGCSRTAHEWFHTIERQRIIGAAIDLGYGCLVFQSTDDFTRCWSNDIDLSTNNDIQMVWNGLKEFYKEHPKLESLPRFTFGASSGGIFSSIFAVNQRYKIQGQIIFISIVLPEVLHGYVKAKMYPPTAWIYMSRDLEFASENRINESIKVFAAQNISHISYVIEPIMLTSTTIHERIPTITQDTSQYIFYRLQQNQWLDSDNCLKYNPRRRNTWQNFLSIAVNKSMTTPSIFENLNEHINILPEFFNTIYGEHEISFQHSFQALQWLQHNI